MHAQRKIFWAGTACALLALGQTAFLIRTSRLRYHHSMNILAGWILGMLLGLLLLLFHIASLHCSRFLSISTIFTKYIVAWFFAFLRQWCWLAFNKSAADCASVQSSVLLKRLKECEDTEYGKRFNFREITSVEDFIRQHPLTAYDHYADYIKRVEKGELGVMSHQRPRIMGKTSGTTGMSKVFPVGAKTIQELSLGANAITDALRRKSDIAFPGPLQMMCGVLTAARTGESEGGIPTGPVTAFLMTDRVKSILFTTPIVGFNIIHEPTAMYVHALFALRDENLGSVWAPLASSLYIFFRFLETAWERLVEDIRTGTITDVFGILTTEELQELKDCLQPMPDRAGDLERQFRISFDCIVKRIWPRMPALYGVTSGSMQTFARRLKRYTGDLPILSGYYMSTEGLLGYACEFPEDGQTKYVCIPNGPFYEFIPTKNCHEETPDTVLMEEVKVGECYELVITNKDGLYRYRMGDVVKITGFYKKTPVFQYQYRIGELLSVRAEKTSEVAVTNALQDTIKEWRDIALVDYVCAESALYEEALGEDSDSTSMYYAVFLELSMPKDGTLIGSEKERKRFESTFDTNLRRWAEAYNIHRQRKTLGMPVIIFLDRMAFSYLRVHLLETSDAAAGQVKIPRKLRKLEWVTLLLQHKLNSVSAKEE